MDRPLIPHLFLFVVVNLMKMFPGILNHSESDKLVEEFSDFQLTSTENLPVTNDAKIDIFFGGRSEEICEPFANTLRYPLLANKPKSCLVLPVSNADSERIVSIATKIQTDNRSDLSNDTIYCLLQDLRCNR